MWSRIIFEIFHSYYFIIPTIIMVYFSFLFIFFKIKHSISSKKYILYSILYFIIVYLILLNPFSRGLDINNSITLGNAIVEKINLHKKLNGKYPDKIDAYFDLSQNLELNFRYEVYKNKDNKLLEILGEEYFSLEIRPTFMYPEFYSYNIKTNKFEITD